MTDEAYTFRETEKERKRLARAAYSKKNGSRSKYVSLSSDKLTEKQRKELNGPVYTYDLGKPMDWKTFTAMPESTQRIYLNKLCHEHLGRLKDAASMFGITPGGLGNYIARTFPNWHPFQTMNGQKYVNLTWLNWVSPDDPSVPEVDLPQPEEKAPQEESSCVKQASPTQTFVLGSGELNFVGNLNWILGKMHVILDPSGSYELTIKFKDISGVDYHAVENAP